MKAMVYGIALAAMFIADASIAGQASGGIRLLGSWSFTGPTRQLLLLEFEPGSSVTDPAACSTSTSHLGFAFDLDTTKGKVALQMVQAARITGLPVRVGGLSTCGMAPGYEDGDFIQILPTP